MNTAKYYIFFLFMLVTIVIQAQNNTETTTSIQGIMVPACIYQGDTIPSITMPTLYCFKKVKYMTKRQKQQYDRMVYNVKKVLPIAKEVNKIVIETYEYIQTLPDKKARDKHLKLVEKDLKEKYTPRLKKFSLSQGKLLIKLINRQTDSSSYELIKAFMGSFRATVYQSFASLFGASLKKEYHPEDEDAMLEQIILMVESGQL